MQEEVSLEGIKVCIALPCYSGYIPLELGIALFKLVLDVQPYGVTLDFLSQRENGLITSTRNRLLSEFLDCTESDYLFWLDDDMLFSSQDFLMILAHTIKWKSVAATYCTRTDVNPTFFLKPIDGLVTNEDGLIPTCGVGLGFACQHRSVLVPIVEGCETYKEKDGLEVRDVFKIGPKDGQYQGEDMFFFNKLYEHGTPTYVDPMIHLKHVGRKDYDHRFAFLKEN